MNYLLTFIRYSKGLTLHKIRMKIIYQIRKKTHYYSFKLMHKQYISQSPHWLLWPYNGLSNV